MTRFRAILSVGWLLALGLNPMHALGGDSALCREFRALQWPHGKKLERFILSSTLMPGAKEDGQQHFFNLDIDGDDIEDVVTQGCSASIEPADPCILEVRLSSGGTITFEAWHLYLIRHRGVVYAITSGLDSEKNSMRHKIYRVGPREMKLACESR
jgi:hypothetical protein